MTITSPLGARRAGTFVGRAASRDRGVVHQPRRASRTGTPTTALPSPLSTATHSAGRLCPDTSRRRRIVEAVSSAGVWVAVGYLLPISDNGYLLLGIPLTFAFQVLVRRRPVRELFAGNTTGSRWATAVSPWRSPWPSSPGSATVRDAAGSRPSSCPRCGGCRTFPSPAACPFRCSW
jgi:hypothetical protein